MRSWSPLLLVIFVGCWLLPAAVHAQTGYEPDQRGDHDDPEQPAPDALYEPDQRGNLEGGDVETQNDATSEEDEETERAAAPSDALRASPGTALTSAEMATISATTFALELRLGPALTRVDDTTEVGFAFSLFGGARLGSVTLGPRFDLVIDAELVAGAAVLEAQLAFGDAALQPVVRVAAGYAYLRDAADTLSAFHLEAGLGLRWNLSSTFALGTDVAAIGFIPHGWQGRLSVGALLRF